MLFVAPRSEWTMLDDWGHTLGLKGSGSNSIVFDGGRIPEYFALPDTQMLARRQLGRHARPAPARQPDVPRPRPELLRPGVHRARRRHGQGRPRRVPRAHHDAHDPPPADRPARARSRLPALVRPRAREGRHGRGGDAAGRRAVDGGLPAPGRGRRALRRRGGPADPVDHARVRAPVLGRAAGVRVPHGGLGRRPRRRSGCSASGATCRWSGATSPASSATGPPAAWRPSTSASSPRAQALARSETRCRLVIQVAKKSSNSLEGVDGLAVQVNRVAAPVREQVLDQLRQAIVRDAPQARAAPRRARADRADRRLAHDDPRGAAPARGRGPGHHHPAQGHGRRLAVGRARRGALRGPRRARGHGRAPVRRARDRRAPARAAPRLRGDRAPRARPAGPTARRCSRPSATSTTPCSRGPPTAPSRASSRACRRA